MLFKLVLSIAALAPLASALICGTVGIHNDSAISYYMGNFFYKGPTSWALCAAYCKTDPNNCLAFRYSYYSDAAAQYCEFFNNGLPALHNHNNENLHNNLLANHYNNLSSCSSHNHTQFNNHVHANDDGDGNTDRHAGRVDEDDYDKDDVNINAGVHHLQDIDACARDENAD
ncbi:hypothetical protein N0V83_010609 [Neocucurbitaria cava]|uniref:Apple domain-containing protein n=1 Tax=Neocucurbitaria cava TaxID=798079 RepID=A0A9W8XZX6_9PLEO|nr:hypothetical protein N0V83_010609 [Neocucurbitaria cava]